MSKHLLTSPLRVAGRHRRIVAGIAPLAVIALAAALMLPGTNSGAAQAAVGLGTAKSFSVLAGAGITNTGPTTIGGNVGTFPTPAETGFGSVTFAGGTNHDGDAVTQDAKNDLVTGYNTAAGATPSNAVKTELGAGKTFTPGVYDAGTLAITGTMTLNTQGDPNAVFIFKAASTLVTASASRVVVIGSTTACNVFWQIGSSATLGTGSHLVGSVLAMTSITATTGATIAGRLLARNGAVTLDTNTITTPVCAAAAPTTTTVGATTTPTTGGATSTSSAVSPTTSRAGATTSTLASSPAPTTTTTTTAPGSPGATTTTVPGTPTPGTPGSPTPTTPALPHTL